MAYRIGRYEVQAELGRGGFGQVFRAYDPTVGRLVAIKTLTSSGEPEMLTRFRNEAAAAGKLRHQNIVTIFDFGEFEGSPFLVMELLDGEDVERIITNHRPLSLLKKLDIVMQSADGLHHAHTKGIIHRDIKPANIMLLADGNVKIMDFGIALFTQATAARITPQGSLIGTLPYMSPEQFYGSASDALSDIFAFGVTCYKLLTGIHPFQAPEMGGLMYNIINKAPAPIRALNPACPEALEETVFRMLAKDRELRYQNLEDIQFDIEPVLLELRREHVAELLTQVRDLIAGDQLESAQATIRQVLEIDSGNRTAREFRERVNHLLKDKIVRPKIALLVNDGRDQLSVRQFDLAIQKFESALRLDKSNPELQALIAEARESAKRARQADKFLENANKALSSDDLSAAYQNIAEALSADPEHAKAKSLQALVEERIALRDRERRLQEQLSKVKGLMLLQSFEEAIAALVELQREYRESTEISQLLGRAKSEQAAQARRFRLEAFQEEAKALLRDRRFAEAVDRLAQFRTEFPESAELQALTSYAEQELKAQKQAEAIQLAIEQTEALLQASKFDLALDHLNKALGEYPGASPLRELLASVASAKAEHQRKLALERVIQQSSKLIQEKRFSEALEQIGAFTRSYGEMPALEPFSRQANEELAKQQREAAIRKSVADAQTLLQDGSPEMATRVLEQATLQFPGNGELVNLLGVAQSRLQEKRTAEAISKLIAKVESLARSQQFDQALNLIDEGIKQYAGAERLVRCRDATLASRTAYQHEQLRKEALLQAFHLRDERDFAGAISLLHSALTTLKEDTQLQDAKRQIEQAQQVDEARKAIERARILLDQGNIQSATSILQDVTVRFPDEPLAKTLIAVAETRLREQWRREEIASIVRDAEDQLKTKRFDQAIHLLNTALKKYGSEEQLVAARDTALAAQKQYEQEQQLAAVKLRVNQLRANGDIPEALHALSVGLTRFPNDAGLLDLQKEIQAIQEAARQAEQQRMQAISALERSAAVHVESKQFVQALEVLNQGLKQFPDTDTLIQARKSAVAAQMLAQAQNLYEQDKWEAALQLIAAALQKNPSDQQFQKLKIQIETEQEKQRQSREVDQALTNASNLLQEGRTEASIELLRNVARKYPSELRISTQLDAAEKQWQQLQEQALQQNREEALARANALKRTQHWQQALALLEQAIRLYGNSPAIVALQNDLQREITQQKQREARDRDRDELLRLEQNVSSTKKKKLKDVDRQVQRLVTSHPENQEIQEIASRIHRQVEAIRAIPTPPLQIPWRWITVAGGVAAIGGTSLLVVPRIFQKPNPTTFVPSKPISLEVRSDPSGTTIKVGDLSCITPNCRIDLKPGRYQMEARKEGYQPRQQVVVLDPAKPSDVVEVKLEPELPPALPDKVPATSIGTLVVRAGIPGAMVIVDNTPRGRTNNRGDFTLPVEARNHEVRLEKSGYEPPAPQQVKIVEGKSQIATFKPTVLNAKLELRGAPAGVEVRVGQKMLGRTDGSPVFSASLPPGSKTLDVRQGPASRQVTQTFEPGETRSIEWSSVAPPVATPKLPQTNSDNTQRVPEHQTPAEAPRITETPQKAPQISPSVPPQVTGGATNSNPIAKDPAIVAEQEKQRLLVEQQSQAIHSVLERFNAAFQRRQPKELKAVWPGATDPIRGLGQKRWSGNSSPRWTGTNQ